MMKIFKNIIADDIPENAQDFLQFWADRINEIPEESRLSAKITYTSEPTYGGGSALLACVTFCVPKDRDSTAPRTFIIKKM